MSEERITLYTMLLTVSIASLFLGDCTSIGILWFVRVYIWFKCNVCITCFRGRECSVDWWSIVPEDIPIETLHRIPFI